MVALLIPHPCPPRLSFAFARVHYRLGKLNAMPACKKFEIGRYGRDLVGKGGVVLVLVWCVEIHYHTCTVYVITCVQLRKRSFSCELLQ